MNFEPPGEKEKMRFYFDSSVRIQVNNRMHSFELTSNSTTVRSVPSEPEDQGSNPGLVTPFFTKKRKKLCKKLGGDESRTQSKGTSARSPTTALFMYSIRHVETNLLLLILIRANTCQHAIGLAALEVKNTGDSWYSSFNLELNFVTSISLLYILQIQRFFFLNFSKITIFSLMMLFFTYSISRYYLYASI
jgi:hypothetical protein